MQTAALLVKTATVLLLVVFGFQLLWRVSPFWFWAVLVALLLYFVLTRLDRKLGAGHQPSGGSGGSPPQA